MAIEILPYNPTWPDEFRHIGAILGQVLGKQALRINHIGSTSVPGLAAKDIIDVQISMSKTPFATLLWPARKAGRNSVNGRCRRLMPNHTAPKQKG